MLHGACTRTAAWLAALSWAVVHQPLASTNYEPTTCADTPGWSNGWSGCAWMDGGKDPALCAPTPNASWPSTSGWTCEYYRQQGLCGKLNGDVKEIRTSSRGIMYNFPEKNCCGCEDQDDTTCNRQVGASCAFSLCGFSHGPAYCHNLSSCLCMPGHCADTEGFCALTVTETKTSTGTGSEATVTTESVCKDAVGWTNGWSGCAYEDGGKNPAYCPPTPGASWPSTVGWTCEYYRAKGLCIDNNVSAAWSGGSLHNYPEFNCCGCGPVRDITCNRNTGGTCKLGACDKSRGPTECVDGKCICLRGHCGSTNGVCSLEIDPSMALTPEEAVKQASDAAKTAGINAAKTAGTAGKNAVQEVMAGATAAGSSAVGAGLPLHKAAEAVAAASGSAASAAKATPAQAAAATAMWVQEQAKADPSVTATEVQSLSAKAAAKAASIAASDAFLTPSQAAYATEAAAVAGAVSAGASPQAAQEMAIVAVAKDGDETSSADVRVVADQSDFRNQLTAKNTSSVGSVVGCILLLVAVLGCCFWCYRRSSARKNIWSRAGSDEETQAFAASDESE
mmetsp:Transcript_19625/g.34729  ORF Transcript_19625/g.34729 Transcript_19625/m.34729 type:complete len:564 (+) Transcript_19625:59-1750(+)